MALVTDLVGVAFETTYGTAASISNFVPVRQIRPEVAENTRIYDDTLLSRFGAERHRLTTKDVVGDTTGYVYPDSVGWWLKGLLGSVSSSIASGESVVYEHTFTQADTLPSMTMVINDTEPRQITGLVINTGTFEFQEGIMTLANGFLAQDLSDVSEEFPVISELIDPFTFPNFTVRIANDIASALASSAIPLDEWEMNYGNNVAKSNHIGTRTISFLNPTKTTCGGVFRRYAEDETLIDYTRNASEVALVFEATGASIGNNEQYSLQIHIPRAVMTRTIRPYEAGSIIMEETTFSALRDTSEGYSVKMILTNKVENYN